MNFSSRKTKRENKSNKKEITGNHFMFVKLFNNNFIFNKIFVNKCIKKNVKMQIKYSQKKYIYIYLY